MKKKHAFIVGIISLLGIYFITLAVAPESIPAIGPAVIVGIVGACGFSLGSNVADNWQRSKYYQPELNRQSITA
jgi:drug/metabolite transporter (DMT)-like permease